MSFQSHNELSFFKESYINQICLFISLISLGLTNSWFLCTADESVPRTLDSCFSCCMARDLPIVVGVLAMTEGVSKWLDIKLISYDRHIGNVYLKYWLIKSGDGVLARLRMENSEFSKLFS